ncbi:isocitrate dehydrogenase [NAD] subunit gamma, mitochondrial-like isoform X1 [Ptychodera flava]|uniref:isocitrate dehydrogenase [NAD] subunit gamma, mitochondrial-like isoform X1 n=1 Tax=Ptychodera flava TaxID=63121 RepID=UPI00396A27C1
MATIVPIFRRSLCKFHNFSLSNSVLKLLAPASVIRRDERCLTAVDHSYKGMPPPAQYGGRHTVTLIPGDGIGPELMVHIRDIFKQTGVPVDFEEVNLSSNLESDDIDDVITAVKRNGVALKGNVETNHDDPSPTKTKNVKLRTELDLFANVLRCVSIPGVKTRHSDIDIVIIRENTEGEYTSLEHENVKGVVESLKIITAERSTRIAEYAFEYARKHGRKKVTAIHKANIMKLGDGLFLRCCREVAKSYPDIEFSDMIIDNCSMQLVSRPQQFDVMVMPNLYGNIVSNIGAGLVGGPGVVPGENIGKDFAVFEAATRNTGKSIAGKNIANPTAMLLASTLMLDHLQLGSYASNIRDAVWKTVTEDRIHTPDLGGQASTTDVVVNILQKIQKNNFV